MPKLAPVATELAIVAAVLLLGGLGPALWAAQDGTGGLAVAAILLIAGGIYFAVVSRLRREATAAGLDQAAPAGEHAREAPLLTAARATLDGLIGLGVAAVSVLIDLGAIGVALVLGLGAYRLWQRAQVRRWERRTRRVLLREPGIVRSWLSPEHLRYTEREALDTSLTVVRAPTA